ncbi:Cyclin CCL1 [Vanrija pseudolonga]|uniref:Cyclin CCL1 n=1 Tax=Vanrija pseudolonga TaxID=143232 RepID=A0AAF0Y7U6_9TREE|nr:Cyclin CCL1 [Vanrija pseudolonga]
MAVSNGASASAAPSADATPPPGGAGAAGPSPYHESSQFRHWRYSRGRLAALRAELNEKSKEVTARNMAAEKEAQLSLGHSFTDPPPAATYPTVDEELNLVWFYCNQASQICRHGFGLSEEVETTAISYMKRFYLKNSVMEWHPKSIMPTCVFLAAKTCNHPVPIDVLVSKLKGFKPADVLDLEFLVAQSLSFEFWVRGADKALRGWSLELQDQAKPPVDAIQRALPAALDRLRWSRYTDAEFIYTPSQVALACFRLANAELVDSFLEFRYAAASATEGAGLPYGLPLDDLLRLTKEIEGVIRDAGQGEFDMKTIKEIDKRLKSCTNPEKIPGTALYIKRKAEADAKAVEAKAEKAAKVAAAREADELTFGGALGAGAKAAVPDDPFAPPPPPPKAE